MSDIRVIPHNVLYPVEDAEPVTKDFEEQIEVAEQEEIPQGVLTLLQQMLPLARPLAGPLIADPASSAMAMNVSSAMAMNASAGVDSNARLALAIRPQPGDKMAAQLSEVFAGARVQLAPSKDLIAGGATSSPASQALPVTQLATAAIAVQAADVHGGLNNAILGQAFFSPLGIRAAPQRAASTTDAGEKTPPYFEAAPVLKPGARMPTPPTPSEQPVALRNRMAQASAQGLDKGEQSYLRLPFASDRAVGHVDVSKAPHEFAGQLQLSGSSADVTRNLAQHLASAEPGWKLLDGEGAGQDQQGSDARQQADDDTDDAREQARQPKWQG